MNFVTFLENSRREKNAILFVKERNFVESKRFSILKYRDSVPLQTCNKFETKGGINGFIN